jgi:uncharacterized glyoxalase superfamily protein PhnB
MSHHDTAQAKAIHCECIIPVLGVRDVAASLAFYEGVLGFTRDWGGQGDDAHIASTSLDGKAIMLLRSPGLGKASVWIGIGNVLALHQKLVAQGVKIVQPPTNQPWALEMRAEDPDGHVLWFGCEPLPQSERPYGT